jgi:hypothetical protein
MLNSALTPPVPTRRSARLSAREQRKFEQRRFGVMKKANELKTRFNAKVAVYILEDGQNWSYQSDDNWPPNMVNIVNKDSPIQMCSPADITLGRRDKWSQ